LDHQNLKTTQHYAKILDFKGSQDRMALRDKLEDNPSQVNGVTGSRQDVQM
jgi:hypothetical protein